MTTIYLQNTDHALVDEGYKAGLPKELGEFFPHVLLFILNHICKEKAYRINYDGL